MNLETLAHVINKARNEANDRGEHTDDICVTLNRNTFTLLLRQAQCTMLFTPATNHTFEYWGALVSWSPAHDNDPDSHNVGKIWPRR